MAKFPVVWTEIAKLCLDEIVFFIALDNETRAYTFRDELWKAAEDIKYFPDAGSPREIEGVNVRVKVYKEYCITYQVKNNAINIEYINKENEVHIAR